MAREVMSLFRNTDIDPPRSEIPYAEAWDRILDHTSHGNLGLMMTCKYFFAKITDGYMGDWRYGLNPEGRLVLPKDVARSCLSHAISTPSKDGSYLCYVLSFLDKNDASDMMMDWLYKGVILEMIVSGWNRDKHQIIMKIGGFFLGDNFETDLLFFAVCQDKMDVWEYLRERIGRQEWLINRTVLYSPEHPYTLEFDGNRRAPVSYVFLREICEIGDLSSLDRLFSFRGTISDLFWFEDGIPMHRDTIEFLKTRISEPKYGYFYAKSLSMGYLEHLSIENIADSLLEWKTRSPSSFPRIFNFMVYADKSIRACARFTCIDFRTLRYVCEKRDRDLFFVILRSKNTSENRSIRARMALRYLWPDLLSGERENARICSEKMAMRWTDSPYGCAIVIELIHLGLNFDLLVDEIVRGPIRLCTRIFRELKGLFTKNADIKSRFDATISVSLT